MQVISDDYTDFTQDIIRRDNFLSNFAVTNNQAFLDNIYATSWLCAKIIDVVAEDMTKDGIELINIDNALVDRLQKYITSKKLWSKLSEVIKWSRLYGGAILYIDIAGQDVSTPLDITTIAKNQLKGFRVYDKFRAIPTASQLISDDEPEYYDLDNVQSPVHYSRVIKFVGVELPYNLKIQYQYYGLSILERVFKRILLRDEALDSSNKLIKKSFLSTVKIDGLRQIIAAGGQSYDNLLKMFKNLKELQNSNCLTILDKSDDFQTDSYTFAGLDSVLNRFDLDVAGACDIPVTRLYGQSPAGFSTGDSDLKAYYDRISRDCEAILREPLTKLLSIMYASCFGMQPNSDLDFDFKPVNRVSELEQRTATVNECNTIISAYAQGLLSPSAAMQSLKDKGEKIGLFTGINDDEIKQSSYQAITPPSAFDNDLSKLDNDLSKIDNNLEQNNINNQEVLNA